MSNKLILELERGDVLPLDTARGTTVRCVEGEVWITETGVPGDVLLAAGESFAAAKKGSALVQALSHARLAVEAQGARPQLAFPTFPELRAA